MFLVSEEYKVEKVILLSLSTLLPTEDSRIIILRLKKLGIPSFIRVVTHLFSFFLIGKYVGRVLYSVK